ncbi:MmgE/PrpD family protein [Mesorhizobium sp. M0203]|uniref:MmgE/PrpD family protein n=1 Tax=Mesorhizobium sp. M0203 TaxID=2956912 RepID=UPI003338EE23
MSLTERIAGLVAGATYNGLPGDVRDKAKLLLLDHIGCMVAGSATQGAQMMTGYLAGTDGGGPSTVFGTSYRMTAANAAHANATSASMLSLDDSFVLFGHPGASIIPAAVAVAEQTGATGEQLIAAIVCGYEMSLRLGTALRPSEDRDRQVKDLASWQIFGACSAASLLHGFDSVEVSDAFGLTPMHAPLPYLRKFHSRPMSLLKNNYGWANKGAITAVELVRAGFHGKRTIFDGEDGFWAMAGSDRFDEGALTAEWGQRFFILETGFKPYGVCRWIHTTVDALRSLQERKPFWAADVAEVHVETVGEFVREFNGPWPGSTVEAAFHIPSAVALELHDKSSTTGLRDGDLLEPALKETASRVKLSVLSGADERFYAKRLLPAKVNVTMNDGTVLVAEAEVPTGAPRRPRV